MTVTDKLIEQLRDEDSYYRLQEKHWCIDAEELERQRLAAADLIETQAREIERLRERWAMIDQLRGAEGCSVEIIHDNPDPGASNCAIYVTDNFGEDYSTYYGDTVDDCLRQAVEARAALGESHD